MVAFAMPVERNVPVQPLHSDICAPTTTTIGRWSIVAPVAFGIGSIVAVLSILGATTLAMVSTWYDSNAFNHCFLVPPIAAYLAWRQRAQLAAARILPEWSGCVAIALASLVWLIGDATGTLIVAEVSLVLIIAALVLTIYGRSIFRILLFPLGYLIFAVPFGLELVPPLQTTTAHISIALLQVAGVPLFSDGFLISIPNGNWYVADACSGVRYVIASAALGALLAGMMYATWWRRLLVMLVALIVPVFANGVRAFGIILLAYLTDNELATGVDHLIYGWLFFSIISFALLAIAVRFREVEADPAHDMIREQLGSSRLLPTVLATIVAVLVVAGIRGYGDFINSAPDSGRLHLVAPDIAGYERAADRINDDLLPNLDSADAVLNAVYRGSSDRPVYLRVGYYQRERRGVQAVSLDHELDGSPNRPIVGKGSTHAVIGTTATSVRYQRISWANGGRIVWYWYWVDGRITGNPYLAKLLEAKAKLLGGVQAAAIIASAADYRSDPEEAEANLRDFAANADALSTVLRAAARRGVSP